MTTAAGFDERTALIVVDVQNDFADPRGSLYVDGGSEIIDVINRLVDEARRHGALVVYTLDWHPPRTPHFETDGGIWPVHCVQGSWGAQLHPGLDVDGPLVRTGLGSEDGYSGFTARDLTTGAQTPTELADLLHGNGVERVVVVGLAQDVCVKETALDARRLGFDTMVDLTATRAVNVRPHDEERANEELARGGVDLYPRRDAGTHSQV